MNSDQEKRNVLVFALIMCALLGYVGYRLSALQSAFNARGSRFDNIERTINHVETTLKELIEVSPKREP